MRSDDGQRGFRVHVRLPGPLVSHRQAEKAPLLGSGFVVYVQQMDRWIDSLVKLLSTILSFQELIMDLFLLVGLASIISAVYVLLLLFSLTARSLFFKKNWFNSMCRWGCSVRQNERNAKRTTFRLGSQSQSFAFIYFLACRSAS